MATFGDGAARPVQPGRLAGFEDGDDEPAFKLPPRRATPPAGPTPSQAPPADARAKAPRPVQSAPDQPIPVRADRRPRAVKPERPEVSEPERPSNVHIPVPVLERLKAYKQSQKRRPSNGDVIVEAIESTIDQLPDLIGPAQPTGGRIFARRDKPLARPASGPTTPLNYAMTAADFEALDALVAQVGASSRAHLVSVALDAFLPKT